MSDDSLIASRTLAAEIIHRLSQLGPDARTGDVRTLRREYSRSLRRAPAREIVDLAKILVAGHQRRDVAYELVFHHKPALHSLTVADIEKLGAGMSSWGAVDCFGAYISGPAWRAGLLDDQDIHRWAHSDDLWWRRAALVSTVYLNRGGCAPNGTTRTLGICGLLAADGEDMVVKAMSWALRELSRYDPAAVEKFISERGPVLAARVRREVRNKLETGLKNPRPCRSERGVTHG